MYCNYLLTSLLMLGQLRSDWKIYSQIVNLSGFGACWDGETHTVVAGDQTVWDEYVRVRSQTTLYLLLYLYVNRLIQSTKSS
jgi:hypothetical protein